MPSLTLSRGTRAHPESPEDAIETDRHPDHVQEGRGVGPVPSTVDDEASAREHIQPLVCAGARAESARGQQHVRRQHHGRRRPSDDLDYEFHVASPISAGILPWVVGTARPWTRLYAIGITNSESSNAVIIP